MVHTVGHVIPQLGLVAAVVDLNAHRQQVASGVRVLNAPHAVRPCACARLAVREEPNRSLPVGHHVEHDPVRTPVEVVQPGPQPVMRHSRAGEWVRRRRWLLRRCLPSRRCRWSRWHLRRRSHQRQWWRLGWRLGRRPWTIHGDDSAVSSGLLKLHGWIDSRSKNRSKQTKQSQVVRLGWTRGDQWSINRQIHRIQRFKEIRNAENANL